MESKLLLAAILISSWVSVSLSQGPQPECLKTLMPCQPYLKGDVKPSQDCCIVLLDTMDHDMHCICDLLNDQAILNQFNVTKEEAMALPSKCGRTAASCPSNGTAPSSPVSPSPDSPVIPGTGSSSAAVSALDRFGVAGLLFLGLISCVLSFKV